MKIIVLMLVFISLNSYADSKRVIGADTRIRITESNRRAVHDSIGLLALTFANESGLCTGTVIGPRHVVTAAHCLVDKGGFVKEVIFVPGLSSKVSERKWPFGKFLGSKVRAMKGYFNAPSTKNDLGLITFEENLPVEPLPISAVPSGSQRVTIAGYPGDKTMGELWEGQGTKKSGIFGNSNKHDVDTYSGQSGAAVRTMINGVETIVGVHSAGVGGMIWDHNEAHFFDANSVAALKKWMAED